MAFNLPLPELLRRAGWKVKIRDKEACEPPHVTILRGTEAWRINLRSGAFLDARPNPSQVPKELIKFLKQRDTWRLLRHVWDRMYPNNPVIGEA